MVSSDIASWLCYTMSVLCKETNFISYYVSVGNNDVFLMLFISSLNRFVCSFKEISFMICYVSVAIW